MCPCNKTFHSTPNLTNPHPSSHERTNERRLNYLGTYNIVQTTTNPPTHMGVGRRRSKLVLPFARLHEASRALRVIKRTSSYPSIHAQKRKREKNGREKACYGWFPLPRPSAQDERTRWLEEVKLWGAICFSGEFIFLGWSFVGCLLICVCRVMGVVGWWGEYGVNDMMWCDVMWLDWWIDCVRRLLLIHRLVWGVFGFGLVWLENWDYYLLLFTTY